MPTDTLTRIITAAPGIRAELWQAAHADAIEQLATAIAERDIEISRLQAELNAAKQPQTGGQTSTGKAK